MISRFLAKVAIACLAEGMQDFDGGLDCLADEPELDRLRSHARRGTDRRWPISIRRIYPPNARWREVGEVTQKVWELDLLVDDDGFLYSVLVIFGVEFVIHLGEPDIAGYLRWVLSHGGRSPLYSGRYAAEVLAFDGAFKGGRERALIGFQL